MQSRPSRPLARTATIAFLLLVVTGAALVFYAPPVAATTYVKGVFTVNTTWGINDTTYVATKDVTFRSPARLTITAGTTVKFDPGVHLFIDGSLVADGTSVKPITFGPNNTASLIPWAGIQFNASSSGGSVSWATFDRVDRAVTALSSSPSLHDNTIIQANVGFAFVSSRSALSNNIIRRAINIGVYANASSVQVVGNRINGTSIGIQVEQPGFPTISGNTITNVTSAFAVAIFVNAGATADITGNTITGVQGARGLNAIAPGQPGRDGSFALGVYVSAAASASVNGNTIGTVVGGRGGDGAPNGGGAGGRGGNGGSAAAIVVAATPTVLVQGNTITDVSGGRGGAGGGGGTTTTGGRGGDAGASIAIEVANAAGSGQVYTNTVTSLNGGVGGSGGDGTLAAGSGGLGGDVYGAFLIAVAGGDASGNLIQVLRGGLGGNSSATGGGNGNGGPGGNPNGIAVFSVVSSATVHANTIATLAGGDGGRGQRGGYGGNTTAVLTLGNNDGRFNRTSISFSQVQTVFAGQGGIGTRFGGNGGSATGIGVIYVTPNLNSNGIQAVQGGRGGDSVAGTNGGRGGDANGIIGGLVANGWSSGDSVSSVTKGGAGAGPPTQTSYANGYYFLGNASFRTRFTAENGTLASVGSYDFYVDNYTEAIALNTPFTTEMVRAAGNLTVRNFLEVDALWPNGVTPVARARVLVEDNSASIWDRVTPTGIQPWILVTDRVYINSNTPKDNRTRVTVGYGSYTFQNDPRNVTMATSHTESFVMIDRDAPTSATSPLPRYENTFTFSVGYTATDGNGTGVGNITLWYRTGGSGGWTPYATQPAGNFGFFTFTASADGVYEFATTAVDLAGNTQAGPSTNNTWTVVDTVRPGSHVNALPSFETSASFAVTWAPDPGVTDIVSFTIQYLAGSTWTNWLVDTTATSGSFASASQGPYAFRSIARDAAGNVEVPPAGNDTWTVVDTIAPSSHTLPLPTYEASLSFTVYWGPQFDSPDIASYRIQSRDNGGAWSDWIVSIGATSAVFTGQDGHTYEFRSMATDRAGNAEAPPSGNDSWTIVDVTPPDSTMTALPRYENALQFAIAWGPVVGITDIAVYNVQWKDGANPWTGLVGYTNTTAMGATFVGQDAHVYAFRSIARDRAGNVETAPATNDTWTLVDVTRPFVTDSRPVGANTNLTPWIVVTFSEPMDRISVEQAFSINPAIDGTFVWSSDSRVMTFVPTRDLESGATYFVVIDPTARDLAGNTMMQSKTFQFSTAPGFFAEFWWVLVLVGAAAAGALFIILRRRQAEATKPAPASTTAKPSDAIVEDVFLLNHKDGLLIKHETRRLRPDVDTDILSGMLTAVQAFVKDALRGDDYAELNEMTVGQMHILIGRGKWLVLAARIEGDGTQSWTSQIERCIKDMEDHHWDQIEDWDGDMGLARVLTPYIKKLIQGGYT